MSEKGMPSLSTAPAPTAPSCPSTSQRIRALQDPVRKGRSRKASMSFNLQTPTIMSIKKIFFGLLLCAYSATTCFGQDAGTTRILTADSLAGGAYKDIFTSFLQLAFDNLTGPNKSLQFNSNPYAIMLKHNDSLASYHYYKKYTPL